MASDGWVQNEDALDKIRVAARIVPGKIVNVRYHRERMIERGIVIEVPEVTSDGYSQLQEEAAIGEELHIRIPVLDRHEWLIYDQRRGLAFWIPAHLIDTIEVVIEL